MSDRARLIGISLLGPPPIGQVHLKWGKGLKVLYGKNGAGKTAILRGIQAALTGRAAGGASWLHVRFVEPGRPMEWDDEAEGGPDSLAHALVDSITTFLRARFDPWDPIWPGGGGDVLSVSEQFEEAMSARTPAAVLRAALRNSGFGRRGAQEVEDLSSQLFVSLFGLLGDQEVEDLSAQGFVSLLAVGHENPEWEIYASGPPGAQTPDLNRMIIQANEAAARLRAEVDKEWQEFQTLGSSAAWYFRHKSRQPATFLERSEYLEWRALGFTQPDDPAPAWVPVPIQALGTSSRLHELLPGVLVEEGGDTDRETLRCLMSTGGIQSLELFLVASESETQDLVIRANAVLEQLLVDGPTLTFGPTGEGEWLDGRFARWLAADRPTLRQVPLSGLSQAQRRWACLAIGRALAERFSSLEPVMLIDEPEQALHSAAIRFSLDGLVEMGEGGEVPIFAATHAPAFLNDPRSELIHVFRHPGDGLARVAPLSGAFREGLGSAARKLGISPADILQLVRLFLVVEGERDVAMLRGFFGEMLAEARVLVVPMHGSRNLSAMVDSRLMFEYTESAVLVAVDHSRMKLLMPAWRKAQDQARNGERDSAERRLATLRQLDLTREEQSTVEFMIGAVRAACHDRVHVFALSEPDGIYYLPAELFVPGAPSWKPIEADYKRTRSRRPDGSYEDIKAWLRREKRADTSPKAFEKAAASAGDALPDEIARLYSAALEMASETYPRRSRWEADSP